MRTQPSKWPARLVRPRWHPSFTRELQMRARIYICKDAKKQCLLQAQRQYQCRFIPPPAPESKGAVHGCGMQPGGPFGRLDAHRAIRWMLEQFPLLSNPRYGFWVVVLTMASASPARCADIATARPHGPAPTIKRSSILGGRSRVNESMAWTLLQHPADRSSASQPPSGPPSLTDHAGIHPLLASCK